jgi:hypothetical protein
MEDWHTFLEENQQKINQINGDNSDLNNSQIVHLYPSDTNLIHEKEKLTFQLAAQEKEIAALQREKQLLQDKIQTLEELLLVYRQQAKA